MKSSFVAVAATLAVASAVECDLTRITPLLNNSNVTACSRDSGLSFTSATQLSSGVVAKICNSTACKDVVTAVKALNLGDCTLFGMQLKTDLLNPIDSTCGTGSGSGNSTGSSAGTPTARNTTGSTGTSPGSSDATTTDSPSTSTTPSPTPSPSPTSAASSIAMAVSAAVVAVTAAFFNTAATATTVAPITRMTCEAPEPTSSQLSYSQRGQVNLQLKPEQPAVAKADRPLHSQNVLPRRTGTDLGDRIGSWLGRRHEAEVRVRSACGDVRVVQSASDLGQITIESAALTTTKVATTRLNDVAGL